MRVIPAAASQGRARHRSLRLPAGARETASRGQRALAAVLFAAALPVVPAAVQTGAPAVSSTLEPAQLAVGDRARLTIRVEHDAGASVVWPAPESLGPFEVLERRVDGPRVEGDRAVSSAELVLTAFELGDLEVPALDIEVVDADGNTVTLETEPAPVTVASVGLDEGGDIRAIRGPLDIPLNVLTLLPWLVRNTAAGGDRLLAVEAEPRACAGQHPGAGRAAATRARDGLRSLSYSGGRAAAREGRDQDVPHPRVRYRPGVRRRTLRGGCAGDDDARGARRFAQPGGARRHLSSISGDYSSAAIW